VDIFKSLLSNKALIGSLLSWFIAQFLKIIIEILKRNKLSTKDFILKALFSTGGMPSSHSATITSIAVSIGIQDGVSSPLFALAVVLVIVIIRDATGVRLSSGRQAEAINQLLELHYKELNIQYKKVKEVKGHTPLETFVGAIVGILVTFGIYFID
jgi:uncharacterized protein